MLTKSGEMTPSSGEGFKEVIEDILFFSGGYKTAKWVV